MNQVPFSAQPGRTGRRQSIRTQLILWNVLTLALLLLVLGVTIHYTVRATMLASVDNELAHRTQPHPGPPPGQGGFPPPPGDGPPFGDGNGPPGPPPPFQNTAPQPLSASNPDLGRPRHFALSGQPTSEFEGGILWDRAALARAARGETVYSTVKSPVGTLRVITRPDPPRPDQPLSFAQAVYPLADVERAMAGLDKGLLLLVPLGLFGAGLGGALLTGRVLKRVRGMAQAAEHVSAADLGERLPVSGHDEFADLAATFNGMLARLETSFRHQEQVMAQQRRFTADASHELKTPLTIIKGNTSMTLLTAAPDDPHRLTLQAIDQAADTMASLVRDLLLLAQSDAGHLARHPTDLLVREILERAISQTPLRGTLIALNIENDTLQVRGSEGELIRLFRNLLDNATRHTPSGARITVTAAPSKGKVQVIVADTGSGIAPEHLPHLGERFYRADAARAHPEGGGTGLGLSIARSIALAHGGQLEIESAPNAGTTVTVTL